MEPFFFLLRLFVLLSYEKKTGEREFYELRDFLETERERKGVLWSGKEGERKIKSFSV